MASFTELGCTIFSLLLDVPSTRDSDTELLSIIWKNELKSLEGDFFKNFDAGFLANPETVCRIRRKLQEKHIHLRGLLWDSRHKMEAVVCQQLTFFDRM